MANASVLFVNHTSQLGGAELILADVIRARNHSGVFLFEDGPLRTLLEGFGKPVEQSNFGKQLSSIRRDRSLWRATPHIWRLIGLMAEISRAARRYDLIYANSQKAFVMSALASVVVRRRLIWHLHDIIDASHFGTSHRRLLVFLANHLARRVIVPSRAAADVFIASGGRDDLVQVVPNGIDLAPDRLEPVDIRHECGFGPGPVVGVFSRLSRCKGQHIMLEALKQCPDVSCIVVGGALFGEDAYVEELRTLAADPSLRGRVGFLGHRSDVPRLMKSVDVVVHPSVNPEPFGRTLVETMLAETPLIATSAGATVEILDHGRAGVLVPPADSAALAEAIHRVIAHSDATQARVRHARGHAMQNYNLPCMLAAIEQVIAESATETSR